MRLNAVSRESCGPTVITSPASYRCEIKSLRSPCGGRWMKPCSVIQKSLYIFERYLLPVSGTRLTTRFGFVCWRRSEERRVGIECRSRSARHMLTELMIETVVYR